jgi:glyoxylase-like metal-dependent hydrolase (beta-lactamase superfamily II)
MKRIAILSTIVAAGLAVAGIAAAQRTGGAPPPARKGDLMKVRDNLYKIFDGCSCGNTTFFVTDKGVVLVDTKVANNGQAILDLVKTVTDKPVIMIINTHSHPDHNGSNKEIKALYPTIDVVAHENLKKRVEAAIAAPPGPRGPLADPAQDPNISFGDKRSVLSGKDRIDLYYFGRGHTDNDIFVVFPAVRAMAIGDLMAWNMAPLIDPGTDGSVIALPDTLEKAQKGIKNVDLVIEGHGNVNTWQGMVHMAAFDRAVVTEARKAYDAGKTPDDALAELQKNPDFKPYLTHDLLPGMEYGSSPAARALMNIDVAFQEMAGEKVTTNFGGALPATDKHKGGSDPALLAPPRPANLGPGPGARPAAGAAPPAAAPKG